MKNKKLLFLSLPIIALALSACNFISIISFNGSQTQSSTRINSVDFNSVSTQGGDLDKKTLRYTYKDLTNNNFYNIDSMPSVGNPHILVIPLLFSDSGMYIRTNSEKESVREDIEKAFFSENENDTGWYSVKSYFKAESYGKCSIEGEVMPWLETPKKAKRITQEEIEEIVVDAIELWKNQDGMTEEKIKSFDSDSNGYLDYVFVVYGYPSTSSDPRIQSNDNLWAWTYWLQQGNANVNNPMANTYSFCSYDFMYQSQQQGISIDAHTYIHEAGHAFGLQDYYDYNDENGKESAGMFSMQDYNIGGHDPFSIVSLGWTEPYIPQNSCEIVLHPFESSGDLIILKNNTVTSVFDEYLIIEMYTPTGVNYHDTLYPYLRKYTQGSNQPGIRLWHVDGRLIYANDTAGKSYSDRNITTEIDPNNKIGYEHLTSNTTYGPDYASYCSPLSSCYNYRLLELIREGDTSGQRKDRSLLYADLFTSGDEFIFSDYSSYFVNKTKLNDGSNFSWNIRVNSVSNNAASITLVKN